MRALTLLCWLACLWLAPLTAQASERVGTVGDPTATVAAGPTSLIVELVVNGEARGDLIDLVQDQDRLWVDPAKLREAGVAVTGADRIDVAHQSGFRAIYNATGQQLLLDVPAALLPTRRISGDTLTQLPTSIDTGALLNYDLYLQRSNSEATASLWTEQRLFGRFGIVSNSGLTRVGGPTPSRYLRFDTRYRLIDETRALALVAGDLITQALPWTTSVRMGGVQLARSFRTRPDLITVPLPSFAGQASVPSGVDLFINGYRQQQATVAPGRFVLDNVPIVNGAGLARIVTTDAVGRQIATVIPFYVAAELLRPGLTDFAVELGALRRSYGVSSFDYGQAAASASVRRGLSARFTVEGHGEAARGLVSGGIGAIWSPGRVGAVRGSVTASRRDGQAGTQLSIGYTYAGPRFTLGAERTQRSTRFADLGSFDLGALRGSSSKTRASASFVLGHIGSVGVGYIDARARDGLRARIGSASVSMPLGKRASAFAAIDYDRDRRSLSAQLRVIVPLGRSGVAGAGVNRQSDGRLRGQASFARSVPSDGGLGLAGDAAIDDGGRFLGQASATWRAPTVQVEGGVSSAASNTIMWGGATGSIVTLGRRVYLANALPDAFAVVATGVADVPVYYENQKVGVTDTSGHLFVPRVNAYHPANFAIDPSGLPIGAHAKHVRQRAALRESTGAVIRLPIVRTHSVVARLVDAGGKPIAPGTLARTSNGRSVVVGWDGIVLIDDARGSVILVLDRREGPCRATVAIPGDAVALADVGVVRCE